MMDLLFLQDIFLYGAELLQSAGSQVPLVLLFQARVFLAQLVHLVLEFLNATLLLLQQLLLRLDNVVELLQVLGRFAGVFRRVLHVAVRQTPVHGDRFVDAAARSRTGSVPIRRGALSPLAHCLRRCSLIASPTEEVALQQHAVHRLCATITTLRKSAPPLEKLV